MPNTSFLIFQAHIVYGAQETGKYTWIPTAPNETNVLVRRGKKINMVLVLWFLKMRARVREIFFLLRIFYYLTNINLVLKGRVGEKFETQFNYFIATSY